jgi:hypothetical protein
MGNPSMLEREYLSAVMNLFTHFASLSVIQRRRVVNLLTPDASLLVEGRRKRMCD